MKAGGGRGGGVGGETRGSGRGERKRAESWRNERVWEEWERHERKSVKKKMEREKEKEREHSEALSESRRGEERRKRDVFCGAPRMRAKETRR